jgi:MYXO-CTERM domain-containing protein
MRLTTPFFLPPEINHMMKHFLLASVVLAALSPALFGEEVLITFSPSTVSYPPSLDASTCQSNGGALPCIAFTGAITDTDMDDSLITLSDFAVTFNGMGSTYLTADNTFYNDAAGLLVGDPNAATDGNPFSNTYSGPIFGLDINPATPGGTYAGSIQISGYNLTNDPGETDELVLGQQTFTVQVAPEPFTFGLTAAGLLALAASRRRRSLL